MQVAMRGRDEPARKPMLDIRGLVIEFPGERGTQRAIDGVSIALHRGETLAVLGPSAAGKSALLRAVAGLETPSAGSIALDGVPVHDAAARLDVAADKRDVALVTDHVASWPRASVAENVAQPIEGRGLTNAAVRAKVAEALARMGLGQSADVAAARLSAGQRQRVALARGLVTDPKLLLLDEAMSCLDAQARAEIRAELKGLGKAVLLATHDHAGALSMAERIAVLRAGRIVECGAPMDLYLRPRRAFTASFLGDAVLIEGQRVVGIGEGVLVDTDIGSFVVGEATHTGREGYLMIRPEFVEMAGPDESASNLVDGTVRASVFAGKLMEYAVETGPRLIRVERPATRIYTEGEHVRLRLPAERCSFVPRDD